MRNKDSYCLELEHELNKYKQALDEIEEYIKQSGYVETLMIQSIV